MDVFDLWTKMADNNVNNDNLVFGSDLISGSVFSEDNQFMTSLTESHFSSEEISDVINDLNVEQPITTSIVKTEPEEEAMAEPEEYSVEAIVGKRKRNNRIEYCVHWLGFPDSDNTWEPLTNLQCPELIEAFESKQKVPQKRGRPARPAATKPAANTNPKDGFARGLKPKRVVGVSEVNGELFYSLEWTDGSGVELVASRVAREKCPQLVIAFLQSKLVITRKGPKEPLDNYRPLASKQFSIFKKV